MALSSTLTRLLGRAPTSLAGWQAWVVSFNAILEAPGLLTDADMDYLLSLGGLLESDDVLPAFDYYARDYWLDRLLWYSRIPSADSPRLSFDPITNPTTYSQSDPLGLATGRSNVIIIDQQNTSAVNVRRSSNQVYAYADITGGTPLATPLWGTINNDTTTSAYNYTLWRSPLSLNETGSSTRRRFPMNGAAVTVYIRGGEYTLDQSINIAKNLSGATHNSRIEICAYPGEWVQLNCGSEFNGTNYVNEYAWNIGGANARPNVWHRGIVWRGWRLSGSDRIFNPLLVAVDATGDLSATGFGVRFDHCKLLDNRSIAPDHPLAGSLPHYVDAAYPLRLSGHTSYANAKMSRCFSLRFVGHTPTLTDVTIHQCDYDFPLSYQNASSGGATAAQGEGIDVVGVDGLRIYRTWLAGHPSHQALRIKPNGATHATDFKMRYCTVDTYENTCLGIEGTNHSIRFNRISSYAAALDPDNADGDGNGIQAVCDDCDISDNVLFNPDQGYLGFGLKLSASVPNGTQCTGNTAQRNIFYGTAVALRHSSGTLPSTPKLTGNDISQNVIVDAPAANLADQTAYRAPLCHFTRTDESNTITANLIHRTDGSPNMVAVQDSGGNITYRAIDGTLNGYTLNVDEDPKFRDAANGDFRLLPGSPVTWLDSRTPLVEIEDVWGLIPYPAEVPLPPITLYGSSHRPLSLAGNRSGVGDLYTGHGPLTLTGAKHA